MMVHKEERGGGRYHYARCGAERDSLNSLWYFWHKVTCAECLDLDGRCRKCTRFVDYPELLNHCKCNAALQPCPTCQRWMLEKCSVCEPTARNTVAAGTIFRPQG